MSQTDNSERVTLQPAFDDMGSIPLALKGRRAGWIFWLQWVLANALGWVAGLSVYWVAAPILSRLAIVFFLAVFPFSFMLVGSAFGAIVGASFGFTQWLILRRYIHLTRDWIWATCKGGFLGGAIGGVIIMLAIFANVDLLYGSSIRPFIFSPFPVGYIIFALVGGTGGLIVGRAQRRSLQQQIDHTDRWALTNAMGWANAWAVSGAGSQAITEGIVWPVATLEPLAPVWIEISRTSLIGLAAVSGSIYSTVTGIALVRILRRPAAMAFTAPTPVIRDLLGILWTSVVGFVVLLGSAGSIGTIVSEGVQPCRWLDLVLRRTGCAGMIEIIDGTAGPIAFSPDGSQLAVSIFGKVRLWEIVNGTLVDSPWDFSDSVGEIAFSPSGDTIAVSLWNGNVEVQNLTAGMLLHTLIHTGTHGSGYSQSRNIAFSPDGSMLASGGMDGIVRLWSVDDGKLLRLFQVHSTTKHDRVDDLVFSPDGIYLATTRRNTGQLGNKVRLWRVADGQLVYAIPNEMSPQLVFSPDGQMLASGGAVWRVSDRHVLKELSQSDDAFVAFSSDGTVLAIAWRTDNQVMFIPPSRFRVQLWRVADWSLLDTLDDFTSPRGDALVSGLEFSPDGSILAFAFGERVVLLQVP